MKKIKTDVHLALFQLECVFFTIFGSPFFNFGPTFRGHTKTMERNQLDFQMQNFMWILLKKSIKKNQFLLARISSDPENSWFSHQQPFNFFSVCANLWTLPTSQEKCFSWIGRRNNSCNMGKTFFFIISRGKFLRDDRKKSLFCYI